MFDTAKLMHIADCVLDGEDEVIVRDAVDEIVRLQIANKQSMAQADMRSAENVKLRQENERVRAELTALREEIARYERQIDNLVGVSSEQQEP